MSCLPKKSISLPKTWPDRALLQCRSLPARVAPPELPKWPLDPGRRLGLGSWHDFLACIRQNPKLLAVRERSYEFGRLSRAALENPELAVQLLVGRGQVSAAVQTRLPECWTQALGAS